MHTPNSLVTELQIHPTRKPRIPAILHGAWAIPGVLATYVFATATGGHPPGLVFLPLVLVAWAAGHVVIWGGTRLARRGEARGGRGGRAPLAVVVAIFLSAAMAVAGLLLLGSFIVSGKGMSTGVETAVVVAIWLGHLAACAGLLLRAVWGRIVAAAAATGWLVTILWQVGDHLVHRRPVDPVEMAVTVGVVVLLALLAYRLMAGRVEREFTGSMMPGVEDPGIHAEPES